MPKKGKARAATSRNKELYALLYSLVKQGKTKGKTPKDVRAMRTSFEEPKRRQNFAPSCASTTTSSVLLRRDLVVVRNKLF